MRDFVSLICMLCGGIFTAYAVFLFFSTLFGFGVGLDRRGTHLDADWPTTFALAGAALVFWGTFWLVNRGRPKGG